MTAWVVGGYQVYCELLNTRRRRYIVPEPITTTDDTKLLAESSNTLDLVTFAVGPRELPYAVLISGTLRSTIPPFNGGKTAKYELFGSFQFDNKREGI